jgi:predicted RNA-binding protein with PIN domain
MARLRNRVAELEERLEKGESQHRNAVVRNKEELARARTETDRVRSSLAEEKARGRRLERERDDLRTELGRLSAELDLQRDQAERQETATQRQLAEAIRQRDEVRRLARTGEAEADARLYLLIDTAERAVRGLRTELNLIAPESLPRDFVAAAHDADQEPPSGRRLSDPAVLREVLGQPRAHLVVDGYNVTKSSYGDLALEDQRSRLTAGLGALAARTGADVTCVFDGTSRPPGVSVQARGLKVIFSAGGQNADSLIKELVRAEPRGRVVVVASSDREVVDDCRRAGCFTVPSQVLAALVERS